MAREPARRGAPSPSASPTPSTVAAFAIRRDTSSPFASSPAFRDVASPLGASHASVSRDAVHATLSPRPMSPAAYRFDHNPFDTPAPATASASASSHTATQTKAHGDHRPASSAERIDAPSSKSKEQGKDSNDSERLTERAFYRRILFQDLATNDAAPSITQDADLDHEIYLLLAYLLRETVLPWYSKLTPDREFLTQVTSIVTAVIHTIVERQVAQTRAGPSSPATHEGDVHASRAPSQSDLPRVHYMLSRDVPLILRQHCRDFRQACAKSGSVWAPLGAHATSPSPVQDASSAEYDVQRRQRTHEQLPEEYQSTFLPLSGIDPASGSPLQVAELLSMACPHPGIDRDTYALDGKIDLTYLRVAVYNLLSSLLPADEFAPDTEKFIVRDVLVTVLRGALARSFRPWFFVQSLNKALDAAGWPSNPTLPSSEAGDGYAMAPARTAYQTDPVGQVAASFVTLLSRLPVLLVKAWTFLVLHALPFLVRSYLDLFNVQREASRKRRRRQAQLRLGGEGSMHARTPSANGIPPSRSTGSLHERKMHGRYPSRKFHIGPDGTLMDRGLSSGVDVDFALPNGANVPLETEATDASPAAEAMDETHVMHDYVGNWLGATEEVLQVSSNAVLRAVFAFARTALGATGLDAMLNRMIVHKINSALRDTQTWTRMVRELRRILLPDGHLPPSVPDPDGERQEAEWIRLRMRLVSGASGASPGEEPFVARLSKRMLLGSAKSQDGEATRVRDAQIQLQTLTAWLAPFCSPQAAGSNTLLAILLFERVIVAICPDLTLQ